MMVICSSDRHVKKKKVSCGCITSEYTRLQQFVISLDNLVRYKWHETNPMYAPSRNCTLGKCKLGLSHTWSLFVLVSESNSSRKEGPATSCANGEAVCHWRSLLIKRAMDFPLQSSDLNPIGHLWKHFKRENKAFCDTWRSSLEHCWNKRLNKYCKNLVSGNTKYIWSIC